MTQFFAYMAASIFAAVCAAYLKKRSPEISLVFGIGAATVFVAGAAVSVGPILEKIQGFSSGTLEDMYFAIPLKVLGITVLSKITCAICEDAGEKGLSAAAGIVTKITVLVAALPLFDQLFSAIKAVFL